MQTIKMILTVGDLKKLIEKTPDDFNLFLEGQGELWGKIIKVQDGYETENSLILRVRTHGR